MDDPRRSEVEARLRDLRTPLLAGYLETCNKDPAASSLEEIIRGCRNYQSNAPAGELRQAAVRARVRQLRVLLLAGYSEACNKDPAVAGQDEVISACRRYLGEAPVDDPGRPAIEARLRQLRAPLVAGYLEACNKDPAVTSLEKVISACKRYLAETPADDPRRAEVDHRLRSMLEPLLASSLEVCNTDPVVTGLDRVIDACGVFVRNALSDDPRRTEIETRRRQLYATRLTRNLAACSRDATGQGLERLSDMGEIIKSCSGAVAGMSGDDPRKTEAGARLAKLRTDQLAGYFEGCSKDVAGTDLAETTSYCEGFMRVAPRDDPRRTEIAARRGRLSVAAAQYGWGGLRWGASLDEFKTMNPKASMDDMELWSAEERDFDSFAGLLVMVKYMFSDAGQLAGVQFAFLGSQTDFSDRITSALVTALGTPGKTMTKEDVGPVFYWALPGGETGVIAMPNVRIALVTNYPLMGIKPP
jgi:hypothetical protein